MERQLQIAYAAGVIDSDGWISMTPTVSSFRIFMGLAQAEPQAVELMEELFGGSTDYEDRSRAGAFSAQPLYRWNASGKVAAKALDQLLPFLRIKKAQASLALAYQAQMEMHFKKYGTRPIDENLFRHRNLMFLAMKELNSRAAAETKREGSDLKDQASDSPDCKDGKLAETDRNDLSALLRVIK